MCTVAKTQQQQMVLLLLNHACMQQQAQLRWLARVSCAHSDRLARNQPGLFFSTAQLRGA